MKKLDAALAGLARARKRLHEDQGRIARANARIRFMHALRIARMHLDSEYPLQRKPRKPRKPTKTKRTKKPPAGWVNCFYADRTNFGAECARSGVRLWIDDGGLVFAPPWAIQAYVDNRSLSAVKKSTNLKKALEAAWRLQNHVA